MPGRDAFTQDEEAQLRRALATLSLRDQALIIFGLHTGFRAHEIAAFTVGHVLTTDGTVRQRLLLERRFLKHGSGVYRHQVTSRAIPLTRQAQAALQTYLDQRFAGRAPVCMEPLFISRKRSPLSRWQMGRIIHELARRAHCPPDRLYGTHTLRKTFARRMHERSGRDLNLTREALGHSSVLTTQRYLSVDRERLNGLVEGLADGLVMEPKPEPLRR